MATTVYGSKTYSIQNSTDDGYFDYMSYTVKNNLMLLVAGSFFDFTIYLNFTNIDIPKGATITNAYIKIQSEYMDLPDYDYSYPTKIKIADVDSYTNPTTYDDMMIFSDTTIPSVDWFYNHTSNVNVYANSVDISSGIQTIINRDGWISGNNIGISLDYGGLEEYYIDSYEKGVSSCPKLVIDFEYEETGDTTPPGEINNLSVAYHPVAEYIELQWFNPSDSDLDTVDIYVDNVLLEKYPVSGNIGNNDIYYDATSDTTIPHNYKLITVDIFGNESNGVEITYNPPKPGPVSYIYVYDNSLGDGIYVEGTTPQDKFYESIEIYVDGLFKESFTKNSVGPGVYFNNLISDVDKTLDHTITVRTLNYVGDYSEVTYNYVGVVADGNKEINSVVMNSNISMNNPTVISINSNKSQGIMEVGKVILNNDYQSLEFINSYIDPIVVFQVNYTLGINPPRSIRVRNVTSDNCEVKIHCPGGEVSPNDEIFYMVVDSGTHEIETGINIMASKHTTSSHVAKSGGTTWDTITHNFGSGNVVFGQVMTENDPSWVEEKFENVGNNTFDIGLELAEANGHTDSETIGYIIMPINLDTLINGVKVQTGNTGNNIRGGNFTTINFPTPFSNPPYVLIEDRTRNGGDGGWGVINNVTTTSVGMMCSEDTVGDTETGHTSEEMSWVAFGDVININQGSGLSSVDKTILGNVIVLNSEMINPNSIISQENVLIANNIINVDGLMVIPTINIEVNQGKVVYSNVMISNVNMNNPKFYDISKGFIIERKVNSGEWNVLTYVGELVEQFDDTDVVIGNEYSYRVVKFKDDIKTEPSDIVIEDYGIEPPVITLVNIDRYKISDEVNYDKSVVEFIVDKDIIEWEARATVEGQNESIGTGLLVGYGVGTILANTNISFDILDEELTNGDGKYKINIYVKTIEGAWY